VVCTAVEDFCLIRRRYIRIAGSCYQGEFCGGCSWWESRPEPCVDYFYPRDEEVRTHDDKIKRSA